MTGNLEIIFLRTRKIEKFCKKRQLIILPQSTNRDDMTEALIEKEISQTVRYVKGTIMPPKIAII